ncbi:hypothetical protein Tco_0561530 [Tanacetum coccineum]
MHGTSYHSFQVSEVTVAWEVSQDGSGLYCLFIKELEALPSPQDSNIHQIYQEGDVVFGASESSSFDVVGYEETFYPEEGSTSDKKMGTCNLEILYFGSNMTIFLSNSLLKSRAARGTEVHIKYDDERVTLLIHDGLREITTHMEDILKDIREFKKSSTVATFKRGNWKEN